jgi:predicted alpha/beta-fold hydrolase
VVIIFHGLEGSSGRHYVKGMAKMLAQHDYSVVAVNSRSCSGEINKAPRLYHHADVADVELVINHVRAKGYTCISLVGFSMGGAMVLNYLVETGTGLGSELSSAVAISSPVDLGDSARELEKSGNGFYLNKFLTKLKAKIRIKARQYPELIDIQGLEDIQSFSALDESYTAPLHGFIDADDFYAQASSRDKLKHINIPTLILIAENDPFMSESCYPFEEAEMLDKVFLEVPKGGGHIGFPLRGIKDSWMEVRALEFLEEVNNC